jgi:rubrerythrin
MPKKAGSKKSGGADELRSIVETARGTERDGKRFYSAFAAKTPNPLARRMFEGLAAAEDEHLRLIEQLAAGEFKTPGARDELVCRLAGVFADVPAEVREQAAAASGDTEVLKVGLDMEDRSLAFYRKWAASAASSEARALCERLAAEEEGHWKLLRGTLDYLDETGNWFMVQERWSFDGG